MWLIVTNFLELRQGEPRRIHLTRTRVNEALSPWVAITSAGKGGHAHERASPKGKEQEYPRVGAGAVLQQRDYVGGPRSPRRRVHLLRAQRQGERHSALHLRDDRGPEDRGGRERRLTSIARKSNFRELRQGEVRRIPLLRASVYRPSHMCWP